MSKLYDKYLNLKKADNSKIYLIKSGIFYLALEDDALELSEKFDFKLTNLNDKIVKCGFPETRLQYYTNLLNNMSIKYEIIGFENISTYTPYIKNRDFIEKVASFNMDEISYKNAFDILCSLNIEAKTIVEKIGEINNDK